MQNPPARRPFAPLLCTHLLGLLSAISGPAAAQDEPPAVFVAAARIVEISDRIEALGTLRANESITVTATVSDTISQVHFDDGDRVKAGQVLVELTSDEESALLAEAHAALDEALSQHERVASLARIGNESKSLLDQRQREVETSRARLKSIEAQLADRLIKAPFAGIVGLRYVSPGSLVRPGDEITTLDDDAVMKMELPVPAVYLETLRPGVAVEARSAAFRDQQFAGTVSAVGSRVDPVDRSVIVRALLPNPDRLLKPGMLMKVTLLVNPRQAVVIPETALILHGTRHQVFVLDDATPPRVHLTAVTIGARQPGRVEIASGLAGGERLVTHGVQHIQDGMAVSVRAEDDGARALSELLDEAGADGGRPADAHGRRP
mgnify:CR=1 FL=1